MVLKTFKSVKTKKSNFQVDAPSILYGLHFILYYDVNRRLVNIAEEGRKTWTEGRVFLKDVDASTFRYAYSK